ncbi:MAG: apolipoprotein N-acyltransferase [Bacteroidetes bacterium]|nr:apolipoprotein N-acyltransferase [Bacteroidota bacterium]
MNVQDKPIHKITLALATALLLWAAWPASGMAPILFLALLPLLLMEDIVYRQKKNQVKSKLFIYSYLSFAAFNFLTTWWIWYASPFGMFGAVLANALLMTAVFQLFHLTRCKFGNGIGYISLAVYWMAFEYFHMDWDLTWPWLNLGNGFAAWADMVQWYEFTGTQGGTLWIWTCNILLFHALRYTGTIKRNLLLLYFGTIALPLVLSYLILSNYEEAPHPVEIVVVQPNIDPYNEKFSGSSDEQLEKMIALSQSVISKKTRLVICPETALPGGIWSEDVNTHPQVLRIKEYIKSYPDLRYLTGLSYYKFFHPGEPLSVTARAFRDGPGHFDAFNAAMQISNTRPIELHFKSKLVPGVEKMPFPVLFGYLENFAIDLGGTTGSLGTQEWPSVFKGDSIQAAPVICYESVYGDYVGDYVRRGANLICILTNDGWWSDTPGYRQHCQYARLRAIEHRRSIARSANTGISCFIDQKGKIYDATGWWVPAVIKKELNLNNQLSFYSRNGDILGKTAYIASGFFLAVTCLAMVFRRKRK